MIRLAARVKRKVTKLNKSVVDVPTLFLEIVMFLTKEAIYKQLFYEFIHYKELALSPGKPAELIPGTILGSSIKEDGSLGIGWAEQQLRSHLRNIGNPNESRQFDDLLTDLIDYKQATEKQGNPFSLFKNQANITPSHPCAWMVFAPLLLRSSEEEMSYDSKEGFLSYLKHPKIAFSFKVKDIPIERTGLYIAVKTANHEMVNAFLCPEFCQYKLTLDNLKTFLSLTDDPKTRLALFQHTDQFFDWLTTDAVLQNKVVVSMDELQVLWASWTEVQRLNFINTTTSSLWLNLLNNQLSRKKIESLLGPTCFIILKNKLASDQFIQHADQLSQVVHYLDRNMQFSYLLSINNIDALYPQQSREEHFENLLASLGYRKTKNNRIKTTRYLLPLELESVHDRLIQALISLPIPLSTLLDALKKIDEFVHDKKGMSEYNASLGAIVQHLAKVEYDKSSFIKRWFDRLLRFLNINKESPLHPYVDDLKHLIDTETPPQIVTGDVMLTILPSVEDLQVYNPVLTALINQNIGDFWNKMPEEYRQEIVKDPIRFDGLLQLLSKPRDRRGDLLKALDPLSLNYFNTAKGMHQLLLETPSFDPSSYHLKELVEKMEKNGLVFCDDPQMVVALLSDDERVFDHIASHLLYPDASWYIQVIEAMPSPLSQIHFARFIQKTRMDAQCFRGLMEAINTTNPSLVSQCWNAVPVEAWSRWYGSLEHVGEWQGYLKLLDVEDRVDFFDKLSGGRGLSAQQFCDLLLSKGDKIYFLWDRLTENQWATWLTANGIPRTSKQLLDKVQFPLRLHLFKAMLNMNPAERADLCVTPDKTIDIFYPKEVADIISKSTSDAILRTYLAALKKDKIEHFNGHLQTIVNDLNHLEQKLFNLSMSDLKEKTGFLFRLSILIKKDPDLTELKTAAMGIASKLEAISTNPFLPEINKIPRSAALAASMRASLENIGQLFIQFNDVEPDNMSNKLESRLKRIAVIIEAMEKICEFDRPFASDAWSVGGSKIVLLQQVKEIIDDLVQQLDAFHLTHMTRFFQPASVASSNHQQALVQKLYQLNDCIQALQRGSEGQHDDIMKPFLEECHASLSTLESKYKACSKVLSMPFQLDKQKTAARTLFNFLDTLVHNAQAAMSDATYPHRK